MTEYVNRPELEQILIQAIVGGARGISVVGPGGTGKTRLVQEVLIRDELSDQAHIQFVDVSACSNGKEICQAIAESFGWALSYERYVESLTYQLRQRPSLLLCLDNAEGVLTALSELIPSWVSTCPQLTIVATSRAPIEYEGEQIFRISQFGFEATRGIKLFRNRAKMAGQSLDDTPEVDADIKKLLSGVSGLPLAIELAATLLRYSSLPELIDQVTSSAAGLEVVVGGSRGPTLSLDGCFKRSWELLNRWERIAIAQLSVFMGAFTMEQAEAVIEWGSGGDPPSKIQIVHSLVNQSLITRSEDEWGSRLLLLVPIRHWVSEKLDEFSALSDTLVLETACVNVDTGKVSSPSGTNLLSEKECGLLRYLAQRPGTPVTRETLLKEVWDYSASVVSRTVDTTMLTLRKKVDFGDFDHLKTVRGVGYQFCPLPGQFTARIEAKNRHLRWHVDRLNELWKEGGFTSTSTLREFQRRYRRDISMCVEHAIQQREAKDLEHLLRYGLYKRMNYSVDLALALVKIGDVNVGSTRKVIVDFFMLARAYEQVIEWSTDIEEDWVIECQFLIRYCRAQSFYMMGQYDNSLEILLELVQTKFPEGTPDWPITIIQSRIAMTHNRRGDVAGLIDILHRPDLPFRMDQLDVYNNDNAIHVCALVYDLQGEMEATRRFLERTYQQGNRNKAPSACAISVEELGILFYAQARAGNWPDAAEISEEKLIEASDLNQDRWEPKARCNARLAMVYAYQGRLEEAEAKLMHARGYLGTLNDVVALEQIIEVAACELAVKRGNLFDFRRCLDRLGVLLKETPYWLFNIIRSLLEIDYCALEENADGVRVRLKEAQELIDDLGCHPDFSLAQRLRVARDRYGVD
jgi:predicted ATPase/tetratricopeptide (TPR) repeat protein